MTDSTDDEMDEYCVSVWYSDERPLNIEAESPEQAAERAHEQFHTLNGGGIDSLTVWGVVDGNTVSPLAEESRIHKTEER